jgi:erythromycin esterase-like protein
MGEILASRYGDEIYSIGVFAGTGSYADNSGNEKQMSPPDTTGSDIKKVISQLPGTTNFINLVNTNNSGRKWLDKKITVNDTFIDLSNNNKLILSKCFDGLILIDKSSLPTMLN